MDFKSFKILEDLNYSKFSLHNGGTVFTAINAYCYGSVKLRIYQRDNEYTYLLRWSSCNISAENIYAVLEPLVATVSVVKNVYTSVA